MHRYAVYEHVSLLCSLHLAFIALINNTRLEKKSFFIKLSGVKTFSDTVTVSYTVCTDERTLILKAMYLRF